MHRVSGFGGVRDPLPSRLGQVPAVQNHFLQKVAQHRPDIVVGAGCEVGELVFANAARQPRGLLGGGGKQLHRVVTHQGVTTQESRQLTIWPMPPIAPPSREIRSGRPLWR
jgi:hypothetical protein